MSKITLAGRAFAFTLARYGAFDPSKVSDANLSTISLFVRHAGSYQRTQEALCSGPGDHASPAIVESWQSGLEAREARLEALIRKTALAIPGVVGVKLGGDPRGVTVKLKLASGRGDDSWSDDGPWLNAPV